MDLVTLAQIVTSVANTLFVVVLGAGYYYTWRVGQQRLGGMREQRTAMGRPPVIVQEDYDDLPELDVAIRNVRGGAARDTTFEFPATAACRPATPFGLRSQHASACGPVCLTVVGGVPGLSCLSPGVGESTGAVREPPLRPVRPTPRSTPRVRKAESRRQAAGRESPEGTC